MYVACLCQVFRVEMIKMLKLGVCYSFQVILYGSCFCLVFGIMLIYVYNKVQIYFLSLLDYFLSNIKYEIRDSV